VPDEFVVGYGLDYREEYWNLPFIGVPEIGEVPDKESSPIGKIKIKLDRPNRKAPSNLSTPDIPPSSFLSVEPTWLLWLPCGYFSSLSNDLLSCWLSSPSPLLQLPGALPLSHVWQ